MENFLEIVAVTRLSRIVVVDKDIDHPIGMAYMKDYISLHKDYKKVSLRNIVRPVLVISDKSMIDEAFEQMREMKVSIAILRSEDEKTTGLITIKDALEALVGNIEDEEMIKEAVEIGS